MPKLPDLPDIDPGAPPAAQTFELLEPFDRQLQDLVTQDALNVGEKLTELILETLYAPDLEELRTYLDSFAKSYRSGHAKPLVTITAMAHPSCTQILAAWDTVVRGSSASDLTALRVPAPAVTLSAIVRRAWNTSRRLPAVE